MRRLRSIAAAVLLLMSATPATAQDTSGDYEITAYFTRAIGLFERSTVRVLGVEVGRVTNVTPRGDRVAVGMRISGRTRIPAEATAVLVPISLISDRYVQLAPVYRDGPSLSDGDEIPLERGVVPAELDDLLATLKAFLAALEPGTADEPGALGQFVVNADRALSGRGEELGRTIDGLSTLLDVLGRNDEHLDSIIGSLDGLLGVLGSRDAEIVATNRGLAQVFSALAEERGHLESGLGNLADLLDQAGSLVRAHREDLLRDLQILRDTTQILVRHQDALIRNTRWLPVLAEAASKAADPPPGSTSQTPKRIKVRDNQGVRAS